MLPPPFGAAPSKEADVEEVPNGVKEPRGEEAEMPGRKAPEIRAGEHVNSVNCSPDCSPDCGLPG